MKFLEINFFKKKNNVLKTIFFNITKYLYIKLIFEKNVNCYSRNFKQKSISRSFEYGDLSANNIFELCLKIYNKSLQSVSTNLSIYNS